MVSLLLFSPKDFASQKQAEIYGDVPKRLKGPHSKFFEELAVCSAKKAHKYRVFSGSKIEYFVVLSVSSFQKFLEIMRNYIHGELSEWSKVQHSKCCVPKRNLGFESLTLRQKVQ